MDNLVELNSFKGDGLLNLFFSIRENCVRGFVTAFRHGLSLEENRRRNARLREKISQAGFAYRLTRGRFLDKDNCENLEETFVINTDKNHKEEMAAFLQSACREFEQEQTLYVLGDVAYRVCADTDLNNVESEANAVGNMSVDLAVSCDNYSKVKNFSICFCGDKSAGEANSTTNK